MTIAFARKRRFRFSLRALLALAAVSCLFAGSAGVKMRNYLQQRSAIRELSQNVGVTYQIRYGNVQSVRVYRFDGDAAKLAPLRRLKQLDFLRFDSQAVDGRAMVHLENLSRLKSLYAGSTQFGDHGALHLSKLTELKSLVLPDTGITDAGLAHLAPLENLRELQLDYNPITDAGIRHLHGMKNLEQLWLVNTQVTDRGVADLQRSLPNCRIIHSQPPQ